MDETKQSLSNFSFIVTYVVGSHRALRATDERYTGNLLFVGRRKMTLKKTPLRLLKRSCNVNRRRSLMRELKSLHPTRADDSPITCLVVYIPERLCRLVLGTANANTKEVRGATMARH